MNADQALITGDAKEATADIANPATVADEGLILTTITDAVAGLITPAIAVGRLGPAIGGLAPTAKHLCGTGPRFVFYVLHV